MNNTATLGSFRPNPPDAAGVLSWVHLGDLHMREAGEQNELDLQALVDEVNAAFAASVSFVFLPGDHADHGDLPAYTVVRRWLDRLQVPWCAIVGDHDVEQKSFDNFRASLAEQTVSRSSISGSPLQFLCTDYVLPYCRILDHAAPAANGPGSRVDALVGGDWWSGGSRPGLRGSYLGQQSRCRSIYGLYGHRGADRIAGDRPFRTIPDELPST